MRVAIPKMWTFRHVGQNGEGCGAVFQITDHVIKGREYISCPNCAAEFDFKELVRTHNLYLVNKNKLLQEHHIESYPPSHEIEVSFSTPDGSLCKEDAS